MARSATARTPTTAERPGCHRAPDEGRREPHPAALRRAHPAVPNPPVPPPDAPTATRCTATRRSFRTTSTPREPAHVGHEVLPAGHVLDPPGPLRRRRGPRPPLAAP